MVILGLSGALGHDPAACLIIDGMVVAMVEEERLTRIKHGRDQLPIFSTHFCLNKAGLTINDVDCIAASWDPALNNHEINFERFVTHLLYHDFFRPKKTIPVHYIEHHLAHAASSFYSSGFAEAAVLTIDGAGDNSATTIGFGQGRTLKIDQKFGLRHSLGHFFSFATEHTGLGSGYEGKLMGLAAYGNNIKEVDPIRLEPNGYHIELPGVNDLPMNQLWEPLYKGWTKWFTDNFDAPNIPSFKWENDKGRSGRILELPQWCSDLAASAQESLTKTILHLAQIATKRFNTRNLVIAGGVGLNCTANGAISRSGLVDELFIVPAAYDAGGALGAAMYVAAMHDNVSPLPGADLGPGFDTCTVADLLKKYGIRYTEPNDIADYTAELLVAGQIVGWFQGRCEIGPRALGRRSIIALPNRIEVRDKVNRIKGREAWRPLSPSILDDSAAEFLTDKRHSPFMLMASGTTGLAKELIPAAIHVDGTARPQYVTEHDGNYYQLIKALYTKTGIAAVLNTSFNTESEPVVCTPLDAIRTFYSSGLDSLVIEGLVIEKRH